jgi:hypothetical protein
LSGRIEDFGEGHWQLSATFRRSWVSRAFEAVIDDLCQVGAAQPLLCWTDRPKLGGSGLLLSRASLLFHVAVTQLE